MTNMTNENPASTPITAHSLAPLPSRLAILGFGVVSYAAGVTSLVAVILYMFGVLPFEGAGLEVPTPMLFNLCLMVAFGLQHSIMARPAFKAKWTKLIHPAMERACYVLATGVVLGPVLALWQPMPTTVWEVAHPSARVALFAIAGLGWAYLLAASFAIDHFELFGVRQVYEAFRGRALPRAPFVERWMYRFDRHPIMTGVLAGIWVTPTMHLDHFLFALTATLYIMVGVYFEERSLRRELGQAYDDYCLRVGSLVPSFGGRRPVSRQDASEPATTRA